MTFDDGVFIMGLIMLSLVIPFCYFLGVSVGKSLKKEKVKDNAS